MSVNINKIATLRNARGGGVPSVVHAAINIQQFGADGITVHPRPDERHIKYADVYELKPVVFTEFNIEGYPDERFLKLVEDVLPTQVTLVPDAPDVLTSNAGWDTVKHKQFLTDVVTRLKERGMRVSLFMETDVKQIDIARETGADRIELYTESYAAQYVADRKRLLPLCGCRQSCSGYWHWFKCGARFKFAELSLFSSKIKNLLEVSIGHALVADALYFGLANVVGMYRRELGLRV
ncbi:MAG: pyridoxine 5'-phosphate synthase [Bacteroidetes bacterium]|nr:pyridoxine 5'-phosphate synthase [Bacteroidota bacterium]